MMPRIQKLSTHVINQIAAGEVIERPASIVKELLENSIDAGSTNIIMHVEKAGFARISITDNGCGIHPDDMPLALLAHATSKLRTTDDLQALFSLGFRGEALASIASVANTTVRSCTSDLDSAWQIDSEGQLKPCSHPKGTTVEVLDLFSKIPVRRHFLKSEKTEWYYIEDVVIRILLSYFHVNFQLFHNGSLVLQVFAAETAEQKTKRLESLIGKKFIEQVKSVDAHAESLQLYGWISDVNYVKAHGDAQYFFVNGRMVKDKLLSHAVRTVYEKYIPAGQFPLYVLYLVCPPTEVDVNIHPTKQEVRFRESRWVHDFITRALEKIISTAPAGVEQVVLDTEIQSYKVNESRADYSIVNVEADINIVANIENNFIIFKRDQHYYLANFLKKVQDEARQKFFNQEWIKQPLLIPILLKCSANQSDKIIAIAETLSIGIRLLSPTTLQVEAMPSVLRECDYTVLFPKLVELTTKEDWINAILNSINLSIIPEPRRIALLSDLFKNNQLDTQYAKLLSLDVLTRYWSA